MTKEDLINSLTKIKGVGKAKAETLYKNGFNSIEKLKDAKIKDLTKIDGITQSLAKNIKNKFKEEVAEKKIASKQDKKKKSEEKAKPKKEIKAKPEIKKKEKESVETKEKEKKPKEIEKEKEEISKEKEEKYIVKKKPKLTNEIAKTLYLRKKIKKRTPEFLREEWFRYKRIPKTWRKPEGISSKMRRHYKYRPSVVKIGFRGPKITRGLHSSGFEEILVFNVQGLEKLNPDTQAARIGCSVGTRKRIDIEKKAKELDIRVLNTRG